jgi:hypothetical protein
MGRHHVVNKLDSNAFQFTLLTIVHAMASLRELHRDHQPLVNPLAHDALSPRLIERAGSTTFNIGRSALLAARYALPDLGLAGFAEMLDGIRDIVEASKLPCLADADDGYGDIKSVVRTIQGYETAGVSGIRSRGTTHGCNIWRRRARHRAQAGRTIPASRGRRHIRSRIENPGGLRPGWQSFQRRLELRGNLRGDGDAVADAGRAPRYGIFANRLPEHPDWTRGEGN